MKVLSVFDDELEPQLAPSGRTRVRPRDPAYNPVSRREMKQIKVLSHQCACAGAKMNLFSDAANGDGCYGDRLRTTREWSGIRAGKCPRRRPGHAPSRPCRHPAAPLCTQQPLWTPSRPSRHQVAPQAPSRPSRPSADLRLQTLSTEVS